MKTFSISRIISIAVLAVATVIGAVFLSKNVNFVKKAPIAPPAETEQPVIIIETEKVTETETDETPEATPLDPDAHTSVLKERATDDIGYFDRLIFLGDDSTKGISARSLDELSNLSADFNPAKFIKYNVWNYINNITVIEANLIEDFLNPISGDHMNFSSAVRYAKAQYLILTFGSFDGKREISKEQFELAFNSLLIKMSHDSPNTKIIVQSILPVSKDCEIISPAKVVERNNWLVDICDKNNKVYFLNTWSALADEDGCLKPEYYTKTDLGDDYTKKNYTGYILNDDGYRTMIEYVRTHVPNEFFIEEN